MKPTKFKFTCTVILDADDLWYGEENAPENPSVQDVRKLADEWGGFE